MKTTKTLERGDAVPHVRLARVGGAPFDYAGIWQHRNLVLLVVPVGDSAEACVRALDERQAEFQDLQAEYVVTCDEIEGLAAPGAVVADRWGEIVHVWRPAEVSGLPTGQELLDWLEWIERRCPECEGEAK